MRAAAPLPLAASSVSTPVSRILGLIKKRGLRDIAALGSGTLLSQALLFLAAPALLRIYAPADLGTYSLLYGFSALLATFSTWKVERLIIIVPSRRTALHLLTALIAIAGTASLVLLLLVAIIVGLNLLPFDAGLLWLIPISVFVLAASAGQRAVLIRRRVYHVVGTAPVARSVVFLGGAIATGLWWRGSMQTGAVWMLLWQVTGDLVALLLQTWAARTVVYLKLKRPRLRQALMTVRSQGRLLGALGASQIVCSINQQIPISVVAFAFGRSQAGLYSLALGLVAAPCSVLATAVAEVVNQRLSRLYVQRQPFSHLFARTLGTMAALGLGPFVAIALLGPVALPVLMGHQWVNAGPAITILSIASYFFFVEASAGYVALIVGARRYIFGWQALRLAVLCVVGALAVFKVVSFVGFLILLVGGDCCLYVLEISLVYRFVRRAEENWR